MNDTQLCRNIFAALLSLCLLACGEGNGGGNAQHSTDSTAAEGLMATPVPPNDCDTQELIRIDGLAISYSDATTAIQAFGDRFRDKADPSRRLSLTDTIPYQTLQSLVAGYSDPRWCTGRYLRGLAIYYGLNDGKLVNIYQPVIFYGQHQETAPNPESYDVKNGDMFLYTASGFRRDSAVIAGYLKSYEDNMEIIRGALSGGFEPFARYSGNTATDNSRMVLYPWQEIEEVYQRNNTGSDGNLYLVTAAKQDSLPSGAPLFRQEVVILGVAKMTPGQAPSGYTHAAADMGNCCPPNCKVVSYFRAE